MGPVEARLATNLVPEMLATDIAEYLVRKGVPFRETHHIAGGAVKMAEEKGVPLDKLTCEDLKTLHPLFDTDVVQLWSYSNSAESRNSVGGSSKSRVLEQLDRVEAKVKSLTQ